MKRTTAALSILLLAPSAAFADDAAGKEQARELLREGNALLSAGDFSSALEKFRAAYAKFASPKILINMGTALRSIGQEVEAAAVYERCLMKAQPRRRTRRRREGARRGPRSAGRVSTRSTRRARRCSSDGLPVGASPLPRRAG